MFIWFYGPKANIKLTFPLPCLTSHSRLRTKTNLLTERYVLGVLIAQGKLFDFDSSNTGTPSSSMMHQEGNGPTFTLTIKHRVLTDRIIKQNSNRSLEHFQNTSSRTAVSDQFAPRQKGRPILPLPWEVASPLNGLTVSQHHFTGYPSPKGLNPWFCTVYRTSNQGPSFEIDIAIMSKHPFPQEI